MCRAPGLGRMCVVLQVLVLLQVLGQVLGLVLQLQHECRSGRALPGVG